MDEEHCPKCGSERFTEQPTTIEYEDGRIEENHDTLDAKCLDCGKDWLIVYY